MISVISLFFRLEQIPNMKTNIRLQLLLTGNEIMTAVTTDTNSVRFANALSQIGLSIYRQVTVGDELEL